MKKYNRISNYSYTLGIYPTIELLKTKPECVVKIITHTDLSSEEGVKIIDNYANKYGIIVECNDKLISMLSPKDNCYIIGIFNKYYPVLSNNHHVVMVNPGNAGNLGTIIRSMLAFDFFDLAIIKPAVDIFNPETIRASMGALFSINFQLFDDIDSYTKTFSTHEFYPFMTNGNTVLGKVNFKFPYSLVFGNESSGLSQHYGKLGNSVRIVQSMKVDSLNVATSVGIALHHLYGQYKK